MDLIYFVNCCKQGLLQLMEESVGIRCRKQDEGLVKVSNNVLFKNKFTGTVTVVYI